MLDMFFSSGIARPALLWQQHDPRLVALSVVLAILASMMALHMAALARRASGALPRHLALLTGAIALGGGIWAMHFIGMLAFALCARGRFDPWMTLVSFVPGLAASWVALHLLMRRTVGPWVLLGGGVLVGGGIGAMHYIGMAASELAPMMRYDPVGFATSIVVAVLLATLALWVRFGLQRHMRWRSWWASTMEGMRIWASSYTVRPAEQMARSAPSIMRLMTLVAQVKVTRGLSSFLRCSSMASLWAYPGPATRRMAMP